jgi:PPOX class probable F420-dependent enzyme
MTLDDIQPLLDRNNVVTLTTFRKDGRPQMSLVTVGRVGDALGFISSSRSAKHRNLLRDARSALMVTSPDWRSYAVVDGDAHLIGQHNTDANVLRDTLRDVYHAREGNEHPDWSAFDSFMVEQEGSAIMLAPSRIYAYGL